MPGDYGQTTAGEWYACVPHEKPNHWGFLDRHEVTEHPDRTITVSPSIELEPWFHGYLERGVWRW